VWLVGACYPGQLSPLALHALGSADAVIHDPGVSPGILELVQPPRYRELAAPDEATERAIKLARDGWRIVRLVEGDPLELHHAIECAGKLFDHRIPFRIIPVSSEPLIGEAPVTLLMVCKPRLIRRGKQSEARFDNCWTMNFQRRQAPLGFSMSGLAG
jgi:siroheme synthase